MLPHWRGLKPDCHLEAVALGNSPSLLRAAYLPRLQGTQRGESSKVCVNHPQGLQLTAWWQHLCLHCTGLESGLPVCVPQHSE